ncbi:MAG: VWA domain-containing protein [Gammaproteobacteria bacterium]|nr:MAG: VWA domain-containing protein [Gammaproteobacteria bacterium]
MNSKLIATTLLSATAATVLFYPHLKTLGAVTPPIDPVVTPIILPIIEQPIVRERPIVEVVFVLDTTGSMGELIQAAKEKIWSIAATMAAAQPTPDIRVGLVAYRDRGDDYVTRVVDLSADLDSMYATLMDFSADGGGDGPEDVNKALYDAVNNISWSQDPDAYQVVFLVGDAPPHMDYQGEAQYPEILAHASKRGIVVNTIQVGTMAQTTPAWKRMASLSQGRYFQVEQAGSAVAIATPFDENIARLSAQLDDTRLYYGDKAAKEKASRKVAATEKLHADSSVAALARRGAFNVSAAGRNNLLGENELIDAVTSGRVDLDDIENDALPESMRAMAPAAQRALIVETAGKRARLREEIVELSKKRDGYLNSEVAAAGDVEESLDYKIYAAVKAQAKEKGLTLEAGPKY